MSNFGLTSIIIPTHNGLHLLASCVEAIRLHTDVPYEIIVVDNGSTDGTDSYCIREKLILVALPENRGFPEACNRGLAVASGDQALLLNNDVQVTPRWLSNLLIALWSEAGVGMVGPVTNYASGGQQINLLYRDDEDFVSIAERFNRSNPVKWQETERLIGMCLLIKREVMTRVGVLDERFSPGHFEDDDYCYRARREGYKLLICGDTLVYHAGSVSFKARHPQGWNDLIDRNRNIFIAKWGVDPWKLI
ncbi:glycosyltransferase family 2 protein [Paenibacillus sp. M1]|uniref:Glycosyltransferase family 2 protein n=1 Tax=Paenibacillus haidiansis TaxID=1574488 RepID=A0ABU7VVX7_9BACL